MALKGSEILDKRRLGGVGLALGGLGAILAVISIFVGPAIWFIMIGGLLILVGIIFFVASQLAE
jgi:hypothetical protein